MLLFTRESGFFDAYLQNFKPFVSDPAFPSFSSFHIVQATFLIFLTTQEKHGGWYYFNKENCIHFKDSLVVIFLNLKLLLSVLLGALWLPAMNTNTNTRPGLQWMETQPTLRVSSAVPKPNG